jgi:hypothetical protein
MEPQGCEGIWGKYKRPLNGIYKNIENNNPSDTFDPGISISAKQPCLLSATFFFA